MDDPGLERYTALGYTRALCAAIEAADPRVLLVATTFMTRDLAPRVAIRAKTGLMLPNRDSSDSALLAVQNASTSIRRHDRQFWC